MALERNPDAVAAMLEANWEIASHGYRWIDYQVTSTKHTESAITCGGRLRFMSASTGATAGRLVPWPMQP